MTCTRWFIDSFPVSSILVYASIVEDTEASRKNFEMYFWKEFLTLKIFLIDVAAKTVTQWKVLQQGNEKKPVDEIQYYNWICCHTLLNMHCQTYIFFINKCQEFSY